MAEILKAHADIVYIPHVYVEEVYELCKNLQHVYAHFIYIPCTSPLDLLGQHYSDGFLIASQYSPTDTQAILFDNDIGKTNEEYVNVFVPNTLLARSHGDRDRDNRDRDRNDDKVDVSGEIGAGARWGGREGLVFDGYVKGSAHDSHGNYLEGSARQNSQGEGRADVYGGHESKED